MVGSRMENLQPIGALLHPGWLPLGRSWRPPTIARRRLGRGDLATDGRSRQGQVNLEYGTLTRSCVEQLASVLAVEAIPYDPGLLNDGFMDRRHSSGGTKGPAAA